MAGIVHSIEELVGHTPLMELDRFERQQQCGAHLLAKLEFFNPTGSVKDRAALSMIQAAEASGHLAPGGTIVEQTSGNTGISLAAFAAVRGYKMEIFLERGASLERRLILQAYGARLLDYKDATGERPESERTHPWQEPEREATLAEIAAYCQRTGAYFNNQVTNPANPEAHYRTTGPEIWQDAGGKVDVLVCMAGTGGTGSGTARYLRSQNPQLHVVLVQPHPDSRITPHTPTPRSLTAFCPLTACRKATCPTTSTRIGAMSTSTSAPRKPMKLPTKSCGPRGCSSAPPQPQPCARLCRWAAARNTPAKISPSSSRITA